MGQGKLQMEEEKVEKIKQAKCPRTKKQVRSFLGLAGYYRKFIPGFAQIAETTHRSHKEWETEIRDLDYKGAGVFQQTQGKHHMRADPQTAGFRETVCSPLRCVEYRLRRDPHVGTR